MPIILGTVQNEGVLFVHEVLGNAQLDSVEYDALLAGVFGVIDAFKVGRMYPPSSVSNKKGLLATVVTDFVFFCSTRFAARTIEQSSRKNGVWLYRFDHIFSFSKFAWGSRFAECYDKVCHGEGEFEIFCQEMFTHSVSIRTELPFVFAPVSVIKGANFTAQEWNLAYAMQSFWGSLARNGNPNTGSVANLNWPTESSGGTGHSIEMLFQTGKLQIEDNYIDNKCDMFDAIGYTEKQSK